MWICDFTFCCKFGKMSQIHVFRGSAQIITILHGGVIKIYYNITWGDLPDLLQYYKGEGRVSRDPKFVLRNIWTAPYLITYQYQWLAAKKQKSAYTVFWNRLLSSAEHRCIIFASPSYLSHTKSCLSRTRRHLPLAATLMTKFVTEEGVALFIIFIVFIFRCFAFCPTHDYIGHKYMISM